jgi:hypothetical protein
MLSILIPADWLEATHLACAAKIGRLMHSNLCCLLSISQAMSTNSTRRSKDIEYVERKSSAYLLPTYYSVKFNAESKVVTVVLKG